MYRVGGIAVVVLAAAVMHCAVPAVADSSLNRSERVHFLFFSGTDIWRGGAFLHGGMLWAANGLDREGFVAKAMAAGGAYRYRSGALGNAEVTGREFTGHVLAGWRFAREAFSLSVFAGLDIENHDQSPEDPGAGLRGTDIGAFASLELWYEPAIDLMIAADASISSIGPRYNGRLAFGRRFFDRIHIGPEIQHFQTDDYRQLRLGVHFTGLKTQTAEWSAAAGWATDSDERTGAYGRFGINIKR